MDKADYRKLLRFLSIVLYIIVCALPVFREEDISGIEALIYGWMGFAGNAAVAIAWFANLFFFTALILGFMSKGAAIGFSIGAVITGLFFLLVKEILVSEGGATDKVSPGIAFYFWIASFFMLMFSNLFARKNADRQGSVP